MNKLFDKKKIMTLMSRLFKSGFFSVVGSNALVKMMAFIGSIILVRVLSKDEYGLYAYVMNCFSILSLSADMGTGQAALQLSGEEYGNPERRDGYICLGIKVGMLGTSVSSLLIALSPYYYPYTIEQSASLTQVLFAVPFLTTLFGFIQIILRVRRENHRFSTLNVLSSISHYIILLVLAYFWGVRGALYSNYAFGLANLLLGIFIVRRLLPRGSSKEIIPKQERRYFIKLALASQLNAVLGHLLMLLDVFVISLFYADTSIIASYKAASNIPSALLFIPNSIMVFLIPYFAQKANDIGWVKENYTRVVKSSLLSNAMLTILLIAISPILIPLLFGSQYSDSIACFNILMLGYFFSASIRIPASNILYTQRQIKYNLIVTVSSSIMHIMLDVFFIHLWGSIGAAIATLIVSIVGAMLTHILMRQRINERLHSE